MKVWNYVVITITMLIFLEFMGVQTTANSLLDLVGIDINSENGTLTSGDVTNSAFFTNAFGIGVGILVVIASAGGIIDGLFGKQFDTRLVILPFITGTLALFMTSGWNIVQYAYSTGDSWLGAIIATIFLPLSVGYALALVEFFGGTD
jgi:hypothetical protein